MSEEWADRSQMDISCPCGMLAHREFAVPNVRGPTVNPPAAPPQGQKEYKIGEYLEAGQELEYAHRKMEDQMQQKIPEAPLTQIAMHSAQEVLAGRRAPPKDYVPASMERDV